MGRIFADDVDRLTQARRALQQGKIVLLYDADGREGETDMVVASQHATPEAIRTLRQDGGGLVCTTIAPEHHQQLRLPYLTDMLLDQANLHPVLARLAPDDIPYDKKSSFGLTINHRDTFTGITDRDRSLTIRKLAGLLEKTATWSPEEAQAELGGQFRSPGHVILLNGAPGGIHERQGHTELSLELTRTTDLVPSTTICEMMDPGTGRARSYEDAAAYAREHGLVFLTGEDVLAPQAWQPADPVPTSAS